MMHIKIGQQVKLAKFEHYIFTVTATHQDGSFTVETTLDGQQILSYQNVAQEMLRPVMLLITKSLSIFLNYFCSELKTVKNSQLLCDQPQINKC